METIVNFIGKLSDMVKTSFEETKSSIGKEVVDTTAGRKGICVDRITDFFGTKISFMGVKYDKKDLSQIENMDGDILVCEGKDNRFFIPMSDVTAVGEKIVLLKTDLKAPEIDDISRKTDEVFKRFYLTKEAIRDILPDGIPASEGREGKKWLKRLVGE